VRPTQRLWVAAGAVATIALAFVIAPASVRTPDAVVPDIPPVTPAKDASTTARELLSFEAIPRSNLFAQDRSAPRTRYVPPGQEVEQLVVRAAPTPAPPRLFGVASGPTGAVALIDADPSIPGAEIYRVGDVVRGGRLTEIADTMVVIEGAAGRTVLRLPASRRGSQ